MKVYGLQLNSGGLKHIENRKAVKVSTKKSRKGDTVELSRPARSGDLDMNAKFSISAEFPARLDRVRSVEKLMAKGVYDKPESLEMIAEKVIESPAITDTVSLIASDWAEAIATRGGTVNRVNDQVVKDYYDQPAVMEEIAGRLIETLGFSKLF